MSQGYAVTRHHCARRSPPRRRTQGRPLSALGGKLMDNAQPIAYVHSLLKVLLEQKGSDLFLTAHASPSVKVDGKVTRVTTDTLTPQLTQQLVRAMMNDNQAKEFDRTQECNFA